MPREFDVRYIIDDLLSRGVALALPVPSRESRVMRFLRWDGTSDLVKGSFGTFVPDGNDYVVPDIVIVPMLAFDRKGARLGRGGGHYDATIAQLRGENKNLLTVGVAYAAQAVLFPLPVEPHDQKMDMVVTPKGVHDFRT
jgi:5-formyltetrahydrofolate cyclo-ligase